MKDVWRKKYHIQSLKKILGWRFTAETFTLSLEETKETQKGQGVGLTYDTGNDTLIICKWYLMFKRNLQKTKWETF